MATEIVFDIEVDSGNALKDVKDIRQSFTEVEDKLFKLAGAGKQGSKEFKKAQLEAARLKEEIDDINESLDDLKPEAKLGAFTRVAGGVASGFTAAAGAAALFGDESEDLQKQLVKVQAAMAFSEGLRGLGDLTDGFRTLKVVILSNPLFLLVAIVAAVGAALFAVRKNVKFLGVAFKSMGDAIGFVIDNLKIFTDWLGISDFKAEEVKKNTLKRNAEIVKSNNEKFDSEIRQAKRTLKASEDLEIKKAMMQLRANGEKISLLDKTNKEELKQIKEIEVASLELHELILDLQAAKALRLKSEEESRDALAKAERKKLLKKTEEDEKIKTQAAFDDIKAQEDREIAQLARIAKRKAEQDIIDSEETQAAFDAVNAEEDREIAHDARIASRAEIMKLEELARIQEVFAARKEAALNVFSFGNDILQARINNAEKGSKEEEKLLRRQFALNKAFQMANAVMNGAQAVLTIQASSVDATGITTALRIAGSIALTVANLAKIRSAKFGGSVSATGTVPTINTSIGGAPNGVPLNQVGSTSLRGDGTVIQTRDNNTPIVKAVVVETDITNTQDRVKAIEESATFG